MSKVEDERSNVITMTKHDDKEVTATICRNHILNVARSNDCAFTYKDLSSDRFTYGTLRNNVSKLRRTGKVLKLPKENPARFILKEWASRPEYSRWVECDKVPMRGERKDFAGLVESLDWGELAYVHDVKVEFDVVRVSGVSSDCGWRWYPKSHSWVRSFDDLEFPLTVQVYDTRRVQVSVQCSLKPIPFSFGGLTRLTSVLGELKGKLAWKGLPNVADWIVTSWHYGKDCRQEVSGASLSVTFETWSRTLARIYAKSELKKIRVEEIQSPRRTIQELFAKVMDEGEATVI
jgi:hypothetical protein